MTRNAIVAGLGATLLAFGGLEAQQARNTLTIEGTSTVRSWTCEAAEPDIRLEPATGFEAGVLAGEKALETLTIGFAVAGIDCGNRTMDEHLQKALGMSRHPRVTYRLSRYDLERAAAGVAATATGELTIAGESRPIQMTVDVLAGPDGRLRVRGAQELRMTDFGVRPPTLMLGTLRVGDEVRVQFDVSLRPRARVAAEATGTQ
jgi:polyisoprenoid-binding protein YceI